jgi:prophage maintenance system killer protein
VSVARKSKEPLWIETRDALAIHDRHLAIHSGAVGIRDQGLLESALSRPLQLYAYADSLGIIEMAARTQRALSVTIPLWMATRGLAS